MEFIPVPEWTDEQTAEYFDIAVRDAFSVGLTSVHDAMSTPHHIEFFRRYVVVIFAFQRPSNADTMHDCVIQDGRRRKVACESAFLRLIAQAFRNFNH